MQFNSKSNRMARSKKPCRTVAGLALHRRGEAGFVLSFVEVLISVVIVTVVFGTIINGYLMGAKRTEWTGCALAAQSLGVETIEQARAAVWDVSINTNQIWGLALLNKFTNTATSTVTGYTTNVMDIPWKGTNYTIATNYVTIQDIFENKNTTVPVHLQVVRVDTVWPFKGWGKSAIRYYTNSICTYIAPDNSQL